MSRPESMVRVCLGSSVAREGRWRAAAAFCGAGAGAGTSAGIAPEPRRTAAWRVCGGRAGERAARAKCITGARAVRARGPLLLTLR